MIAVLTLLALCCLPLVHLAFPNALTTEPPIRHRRGAGPSSVSIEPKHHTPDRAPEPCPIALEGAGNPCAATLLASTAEVRGGACECGWRFGTWADPLTEAASAGDAGLFDSLLRIASE